jgi:hypothetical protein
MPLGNSPSCLKNEDLIFPRQQNMYKRHKGKTIKTEGRIIIKIITTIIIIMNKAFSISNRKHGGNVHKRILLKLTSKEVNC